jgi:oxazoline/thiazoline synthase
MIPGLPKLRDGFSVDFQPNLMVLTCGTAVVTFEGRAVALFRQLVPLLDGTREVAALADAFRDQLGGTAAQAVDRALELLVAKDVIADAAAERGQPAAWPFYRAMLPSTIIKTLPERLPQLRIELHGDSRVAREIERGLADTGIACGPPVSANAADSLLVVAPEISGSVDLRDTNTAMLAERRQWMQVLPFDGTAAVVGPVFVPGETACAECFTARRAANGAGPSRAALPARFPATAALDASVAATAVTAITLRLLYGDSRFVGRFSAFELYPEMRWTTHDVHRVPRCLRCARPGGVLPWYENYDVR